MNGRSVNAGRAIMVIILLQATQHGNVRHFISTAFKMHQSLQNTLWLLIAKDYLYHYVICKIALSFAPA